ncbi:MAG: helix-turn-helix domain-containing protein [Ignavibacteria bacterium]|nr:helix-turn-helix domain-containing protein [Ignavibacteria bacterium]
MNDTISSKTAAAILNVNESTIKRWADSNILKCVRTAGGHRKFTIEEIRNYANRYQNGNSGLTQKLNSLESKSNLQAQNFKPFIRKIERNLISGDTKAVYDILFSLFLKKIHPSIISDQIIKKSFESISEKYKMKSLGIEDEHIASNTMISALSQLEKSIIPQKNNDKKVVCCSLENEFHGIGLLCLKISLLYSGYDCIFPGANLPLENLLSLINENKPEIVCISNSTQDENKLIQKQFKKLEELSKKKNFSLFIGGSRSNTNRLSGEVYCDSIEAMLRKINKRI